MKIQLIIFLFFLQTSWLLAQNKAVFAVQADKNTRSLVENSFMLDTLFEPQF